MILLIRFQKDFSIDDDDTVVILPLNDYPTHITHILLLVY
jgi:hypothetical protein